MMTHYNSLRDTISLEVTLGDSLIFSSTGKWLYPLFELESFIEKEGLKVEDLHLHDRIAGRAAAALICRMGFKTCFIDTISKPGRAVFEKEGVHCTAGTLVEKILCKTEDLVTPDMSLNAVYEFLKRRAGLIDGVALKVDGLSVSFGDETVLKEFSLAMKPGERMIITGNEGAGKSTLIKTLVGAVAPDTGEIVIGDPGDFCSNRPAPAGLVNWIPGESPTPLLVEEVVASGIAGEKKPGEDKSYEIEIAMRRTGCFQLMGQKFYSLTGGEKLQVSLARCLAGRSGLILLDEPTSMIAPEEREIFLDVLGRVAGNQLPTVLLVSRNRTWTAKLGWPVRELKAGRLSLKST